MKEKYLKPAVANADVSAPTGLVPWGVVAKAAAMAVGYAAGRAITNSSKAVPYFKLPSLKKFEETSDDFSMA